MPRVALFLLGPPRIERDGVPVEVDTRKAIALASYLAIAGGRHSRDELAAVFWPLSDQTRARAALRRTLSTLRKALGQETLEVEGECLALPTNGALSLDVHQFLNLLARHEEHAHPGDRVCPACMRWLSQAVELYRADFMSGFTLRDSPGFDEWQSFQSESLRLKLSGALQALVGGHCDRQEFDRAIESARRWIALDPLNELAHYRLMELYKWVGERSAAVHQYQEYVALLQRELAVPPGEEITQLYHLIRDNEVLPVPTLRAPATVHNLPPQPTPFVGRDEELSEIGQLIDRPSCRLLTLFGPGGIGKTRLALELASQRLPVFADGVFFVSLAQLSSGELLGPAIAESLRLSLKGSAGPMEQLLNYLCDKEILLLLDNFEHMLEGNGPALLLRILSDAPRVKLLVTSRERLNLQWEWPYEVGGLGFPLNGRVSSLETYDAPQLFLQSARRAYPGFKLSDADKAFVIDICRVLDGMPLGIELAAAWVEVSTCQHIAREIERNLGFLTTRRRDVPQRHRSLEAAFEHSWQLLSAEGKNALIRLAVFRNGFRLEAAQQVADVSLMHVSALMHKSFLRRRPTGRYEMLEVLRQYAEQKLRLSPSVEQDTRDRHCVHYAEFLRQREALLKGSKPQQVLEEIGQEIDNVRLAWQWALQHRKREQIAESLEGLYSFFEMRGWFAEGEEAFSQAAKALAEEARAEWEILLAKVLTRQGWFCLKLSRFEGGQELLNTSLSALKRLDEPAEMALALNHLGYATAVSGDFDRAAQLLKESINLYNTIHDPLGVAKGLNNIGIVAMIQKRFAEARQLLQESLNIRRRTGNLKGVVDSLTNLGLLAETMGDYSEARQFHQECFGICIEMGDGWALANSLCSLAFSLCAQGKDYAAQKCFQESMDIAVELQAVDLVLENLIGIACVMEEEGRHDRSVELVACTLGHPAITGKAKERAEHLVTDLASRLPPQLFATARERGKAHDVWHYARVYGPRQHA
jgi:predicted ATPase/DNA-binding SARP family transcriptional activator